MIEAEKERKSLIAPLDVPNFFDVHKNKKIKPKDNNQSLVDASSVHKTNKIKLKDSNQNYGFAANSISDYLLACNKTTEIFDVDNNEGINDDNKWNVHVPEIVDADSENIDVKTESIIVGGDKNNTIYAEIVDRTNDIHFVQEVTDYIIRHEIHYKSCYSQYYMYVCGIHSTSFVNPFGLWVSVDLILTLHNGLMQPYFLTKKLSAWASYMDPQYWRYNILPSIQNKQSYKKIQKTPLTKEKSYVSQVSVDN